MVAQSDNSTQDLISRLRERTAEILETDAAALRLDSFLPSKGIADETLKLKAYDAAGQCVAVVLCSGEASPEVVKRSVDAARDASAALGSELGRVPLQPLGSGEVGGLTFAVMPVVLRLSESKYVRYFQYFPLRNAVFDWLALATTRTLFRPEGDGTPGEFEASLRHIVEFDGIPAGIRDAGQRALERLSAGEWKPAHVLMHGDLWIGNVMVNPRHPDTAGEWRYVIIDWAGSAVRGYPFYDLVRFADSARCSRRRLRAEVRRHLDLLGYRPEDARSSMVAALGHLGRRLECFPVERFLRMTEKCVRILEIGLGGVSGAS